MDRDAALATMRARARIARERDGQEMTAPGIDPLIDKHGRELFGEAAPADDTPAELRYVAPKRVLLEWIGQKSPLQSETVLALKTLGLLTAFHVSILEQAAAMCATRVDGKTSRTITKERDGLTETVRWGPNRGTYIRDVAMVDAERILASPAGSEFRVREKGAIEEAHPDDDSYRSVLGFLRRVSRNRGLPMPPTNEQAARVRVRLGEPEALAGLSPSSNTIGWWK